MILIHDAYEGLRNPIETRATFMIGPGETAIDRVFHEKQPQLLALLCGLVHDPDLAEDLLQECYMHLQQAINRGVAIQDPFRWCCGTIRNLVRMHWRNKHRARVLFDQDLCDLVVQAYEDHIEELDTLVHNSHHLHRCIDELGERARTAIRLRYFDQVDVTTAADLLSCLPRTFNVILFRARRALADCLRNKGIGP